jgi:hypothetical protein
VGAKILGWIDARGPYRRRERRQDRDAHTNGDDRAIARNFPIAAAAMVFCRLYDYGTNRRRAVANARIGRFGH